MNRCTCLFVLCVTAFFRVANAFISGQDVAEPHITITSNGVEYTYTDDESNTALIGATKICHTGVWLGHTEMNYNGGIIFFSSLEYRCSEIQINIGSVRLIGSRDTYSALSVTLFAKGSFGGNESFIIEAGQGIPNISTTLHSMVTIHTEAEFFQGPNYTGEALCYKTDEVHCDDSVCWTPTGFNAATLPWDPTFAKSVKVGCGEFTSKI